MTLLLLLLLTACGDKDDDTGPASGDGGGTEDGGASDGGAGGDGGAPFDTACSTIMPIDDVGRVWTWQYDGDPWTGTAVRTALGAEDFRGQSTWKVVVESQTSTEDDFLNGVVETSWYRCDDQGVWLLGRNVSGWSKLAGSGGKSTWDTDYEYVVPGLFAPSTVAVGDTWTYSYEASYKGGDTIVSTTDYEVVGASELTVAAGTYDALGIAAGGTYTYYVAEDVGLLLDQDLELVSME